MLQGLIEFFIFLIVVVVPVASLAALFIHISGNGPSRGSF